MGDLDCVVYKQMLFFVACIRERVMFLLHENFCPTTERPCAICNTQFLDLSLSLSKRHHRSSLSSSLARGVCRVIIICAKHAAQCETQSEHLELRYHTRGQEGNKQRTIKSRRMQSTVAWTTRTTQIIMTLLLV